MVTRFLAYVMIGLLAFIASCGDDPIPPPDDGLDWGWYTFGSEFGVDVQHVAIDRYGVKWLATQGHGVIAFNDSANTWVHYTQAGGFVNTVYIDPAGIVWTGGSAGLRRFDGNTWAYVSGLPDTDVWAITTDHDNNLWVGTHYGGLCKFDGHSWAVYDTTNSEIPANWIFCITEDLNHNIWVGAAYNKPQWSRAGLAKFDGQAWEIFNEHNSPISAERTTYTITIDEQNRKWIGTNWGLFVYDDQTWTVYDESDFHYLGNNAIVSIDIDADGNKWFSTHTGGILLFDDVNWTQYYAEDYGDYNGLFNHATWDSKESKLWLGTASGLLSLKKRF